MQDTKRLFWFNFLAIAYLCVATGLASHMPEAVQTRFSRDPVAIVGPMSTIEISDEIEQKYREVLLPTVRIETSAGTGSGVVIRSTRQDDGTYENVILTAKHVIMQSNNKPFKRVKVSCYFNAYRDIVNFEGYPVAWSRSNATDLAIVILKYNKRMPYVAKILPNSKTVRVFEKAIAVGCTLGTIPPSPSEGIIAIPYVKKIGSGPILGLASTPVAGGNSGGGIYVKKQGTYYLVGVVLSTSLNHIKQDGQEMSIPYPNHAWYISDEEIRAFLYTKGF